MAAAPEFPKYFSDWETKGYTCSCGWARDRACSPLALVAFGLGGLAERPIPPSQTLEALHARESEDSGDLQAGN